ncbi:MAG: flippase-like domain-containing protein [Actinobacteria bacterium]|nr:flippase-like domain-containing protein [Actinomycetota bacterium]
MKKVAGNWKVWAGILTSLLFMFLAFRQTDFVQMWSAFKSADYWWFIPALIILFTSHFMRSIRWRYLLLPVKEVQVGVLFSSLMIGYMANIFLPAHLGEFLRAFMVRKKRQVPASAVFGTIVIERIIDVFTLLALMALTMVVFPSFPDWVRKSGYISFMAIGGLLILLVVMKKHREQSLRITERVTKPLPEKLRAKITRLLHSFLDGIVPLKNWKHYLIVVVLSILIWVCYGVIFQISIYAFNFDKLYALPWTASLVLLVITTISILVPSSPGYVGTYHYLCVLSLGLFHVPKSPALSFAFVVHGISFLPILVLGLILLSAEGMSFKSLQEKPKMEEDNTHRTENTLQHVPQVAD